MAARNPPSETSAVPVPASTHYESRHEARGPEAKNTGLPSHAELSRIKFTDAAPLPNKLLDSILNAKAGTTKVKGKGRGIHRDIVLVAFDSSLIDTALNLVCTLKRLGISNLIGIALDQSAMKACSKFSVDCVLAHEQIRNKPKLRSRNVLEALLRGYDVLWVDVDALVFKNPLPYLRSGSGEWDFQVLQQQSDEPAVGPSVDYPNLGFYYIVSNNRSIEFLYKVWVAGSKVDFREQRIVAHVLKSMGKDGGGHEGGLDMTTRFLNSSLFSDGRNYFSGEKEGSEAGLERTEDRPKHPFVVLNKKTADTKQKTVKELGMWFLDKKSKCIMEEKVQAQGTEKKGAVKQQNSPQVAPPGQVSDDVKEKERLALLAAATRMQGQEKEQQLRARQEKARKDLQKKRELKLKLKNSSLYNGTEDHR